MARLAATTVVEILQDRAAVDRRTAEAGLYEYRFIGYGDMEGAVATLQSPGMELTWGTSD
jgi:hypothetical protein